MERMEETRQWIAGRGKQGAGQAAGEAASEWILINKGWFYLFFLLACLFLWVERKI
jgi:hypothetical protein